MLFTDHVRSVYDFIFSPDVVNKHKTSRTYQHNIYILTVEVMRPVVGFVTSETLGRGQTAYMDFEHWILQNTISYEVALANIIVLDKYSRPTFT